MKNLVLAFCAAALAAPLFAGTYYVSPSGSAEAAGTEDDPYDLATGVHKAYSYSFDELRFLPGTYKCGTMNRDEWRIIGGGTLYVGWGATRDDVVLDFEGAGTKLTVENGMVANLTVSNFNREERNIGVPTIRVEKEAPVKSLTVRDSRQCNRTGRPIRFLDINGRVENLVVENNLFLPSEADWRDCK